MCARNLKALLSGMACISALLCTSCDDMSRFNRRSTEYYANVATECDTLLARGLAESIPEARKVALETNSLPPLVRQLGPSHVLINERCVELLVGSYNITWARSQNDEHLWQLSTHREGHGKTLYSLRKP
jgi:hypothetical protein